MNNNKKRNTVVAGLAVTLLVGASSFAYFTDRAESTFTGKAGTVTLGENSVIAGDTNMAPGDVVEVNIANTYTGSLKARARIVITQDADADALSKLGDKSAEEGFVLKDDKGVVELSGDSVILDLGEIEAGNEAPQALTKDLKLELLAKSGNKYQDKGVSFDYEVQVLQADHTNGEWQTLEKQTIEILSAK